MLSLLFALFLVAIPVDLTAATLQGAPQAGTENASTKLAGSEISDLQKKADAGDASAQYSLGKAYESGNGLPKNTDEAAIWYRKAAEQGNEKAQNALGVLYWLGDGVGKDKAEAVHWYRKAARQGNASAMFNLGAAYYNGEGTQSNDTLAYAWFLLSSEAGNSSGQDAVKRSQSEHSPSFFGDACLVIGQMYEKGDGLPKNLEAAATWYRKASENGNDEATISLAAMYLKAADYSQARPWCEVAVKRKLPGGFYCLGNLYQHGFGVDANPKQAFGWYEQGARGGNVASMQALARMYEAGEGTKPDRSQAFLWFLSAARLRNRDAIAEANRLRSSMTEKEWKATQKKLPRAFDTEMVNAILSSGGSRPTP